MIDRKGIGRAFPVKSLGELVEFLDSRRRPVKVSDREPGAFPYYGANGLQGTINDYIFDEPLILLAEDGGFFDQPERGIAYRISGKSWVNNHAHVLRPRAGVELYYLCRVLENYDVSPYISGTTRSKLTKAQAEKIAIPLPPVQEQRRIATILDKADELRVKRRRAIQMVDQMPRALFQETFKLSRFQSNGWSEVSLADIVRDHDQINYGVVQPGHDYEGGVPLVRVANIVDKEFTPNAVKNIDPKIESQYKRSRLHGDEILVACVGSIGAVALATPQLKGANIARAVARVRVDTRKADRVYVAEFLRLDRTQHYFRVETRAVAQPTLNIKQLCETRLVLPPLDLQKEFAQNIARVDGLRLRLVEHLRSLEGLFASLQNRAFRGDLSGENATIALAMAG
jgi:type I restriction enzyme S subunit